MILQSCANTEPPESETDPVSEPVLSQVSWVLGSWVLETPGGVVSESWAAVSDSEYNGFSMMVSPKGDTLFTEKLRMLSRNDTIWYMPTISNQNNGKEVSFKGRELTANKIVFENPEHDFPQRIVYEHTSDTTVLAYIEGTKDGKYKKEEYPYTKK